MRDIRKVSYVYFCRKTPFTLPKTSQFLSQQWLRLNKMEEACLFRLICFVLFSKKNFFFNFLMNYFPFLFVVGWNMLFGYSRIFRIRPLMFNLTNFNQTYTSMNVISSFFLSLFAFSMKEPAYFQILIRMI